jgi:hypothetical protein
MECASVFQDIMKLNTNASNVQSNAKPAKVHMNKSSTRDADGTDQDHITALKDGPAFSMILILKISEESVNQMAV